MSGLTTAQIDAMTQSLATPPTVYQADALIALSLAEFDKTFVITDALNLITLLVAALSLACTVSVLLDNTAPQRFLLRSLGFSSRYLSMASIMQYTALVLLACLLALPCAVIVAWVLIHSINFTAFLWTYPLQVAPHSIFPVIGVTVFVVVLVIMIPLRISARRPLSEEIAWLD